MIIKFFEKEKIDKVGLDFYLVYGDNEGQKEDILQCILKSQCREKLSYNNLKSKFELKQYENNLKSNLVQEITQDILIYLNSIK